MGFSLGGSKESQKSEMNQNIFDPQAQGLEQMYGRADETYQNTQDMANRGAQLVPGVEQGMQNTANLGMQGMGNQMAGGSYGDTSDIRANLMDQMNGGRTNTSMMYENIVGGPGNTYIDPMVEAMQRDSMQNLGMMQAGNAMDANSMGQGGSSRHAMQNAMTNRQVNQDMMDRSTQMRGDNYAQDMDWKMNIAGLADQNQQLNLDRQLEMMQGADANQQAAMGYAPTQQSSELGVMAPSMMASETPWMGMEHYANVMGDPTVLTDQKSKGSSGSFSLGT